MGKSRPSRGLLVVVAVVALLGLAPATASAATATTEPATGVTSTSATLNGMATPSDASSSYYFQYRTTTQTSFNTTSPEPISTAQSVPVSVNGLLPDTTYEFQLVIQGLNAADSATGQIVTFTTAATPGTIATTGQATGVTAESAELNGVANTSDASSLAYFEYGRTTAYGSTTPQQQVGQGFHAVSAAATHLSPRTTYHFRLVVLQSSVTPNYGADLSFTTPAANGRATLTSRGLKVHHGFAAIPFKCTGVDGALCKGKVSLKARGKVGRHVTTVSCGNGRLSTSATRRQTVHAKLGRCGGLFRNARHGRLHATLRAVFSTDQRPLQTGVTLIRP